MGDIYQHSIKLNNELNVTILNKKSIKFNTAQELAQWLYLNKHTTNNTGFLVIKKIENSIDFDTIYPVNSVYLTYDKNVNPNTFMPRGSWQRIGGGRALWNGNPNTFTEEQRYLNAGLPNITGTFQGGASANTQSSGAFINNGAGKNGYGSYGTQFAYYSFDANNGASVKGIYGNSTTVQPPAVTVFAWLRVS